jgi:hypothetical protein
MANTLTVQLIQDGENKTIIKVDGVVDTSDMAVTGTIGASGFTTTAGLKTIAFVAGALVPTLGQSLTFGDSATTFSAGTYVTAITDATHIVVNQAAKATNAAAAITITGTTGNIVLLDPLLLSAVDQAGTLASKLRIDRIVYDVEDLLAVNLIWEGTTNANIWHLVGRGKLEFGKQFGGLSNNATVPTGKILLTTQGWASSAILSFSFTMECTKQFAPPM